MDQALLPVGVRGNPTDALLHPGQIISYKHQGFAHPAFPDISQHLALPDPRRLLRVPLDRTQGPPATLLGDTQHHIYTASLRIPAPRAQDLHKHGAQGDHSAPLAEESVLKGLELFLDVLGDAAHRAMVVAMPQKVAMISTNLETLLAGSGHKLEVQWHKIDNTLHQAAYHQATMATTSGRCFRR